MTVPSTAQRAGPFSGNGVTTAFPFTFKTLAAADLRVVRLVNSVETTLVLNTDYSVTLNPDQDASPGGSVTYPISGSPLPVGGTLTIVGDVDLGQATDLPAGGAYRAKTVEDALDTLALQILQLDEQLDRTLQLPVTVSSSVSAALPTPEPSRVIGWNSSATALENIDPSLLATIVAFGTARADVFDGDGTTTVFTLSDNPGNQNNLDISIGGVTQTPGIDYTWSSGTTLTFTSPPPPGTDNVLVRYMQGLPQSGSSLPNQTGNAGKFLTTDGNNPSWDIVPSTLGVNVFSYMTDGQIADVKAGTLLNDVSDEIQAAINAAKAGAGGQVLFPRGQYRITKPLVLDYSTEPDDPVAGRINRVSLVGEGGGSSQLVAEHGGALITYTGNAATAGRHSFFNIYGLSLTHKTARLAGSIGIQLDNCSFWRFEDLSILGFEYGIDATDTLTGSFNSGRLWSNMYGARFRRVDFSQPNAISFRSVAVAGNRYYGLYLEHANLFTMYGGSVEGNGIAANTDAAVPAARTDCWGVKIVDAGGEGVVGLAIHGGYFEGNSGNADIWISQSDDNDGLFPAGTAISTIVGTSFLRFSGTQYTDRNILYDNDPSRAALRIAVVGCGFRSQSPYVASALRPYIGAQVGKVHSVGNYFQSTSELDAAVFAPTSLSQIPTASLPAASAYLDGSVLWDTTTSRLRVGNGSTWKSVAEDPAWVTYSTDDSPTWTYNTTGPRTLYSATMAANRSISLGTTGAFAGAMWLVRRTSSSAFNMSIFTGGGGELTKLLAAGDWAEFRYTGSAWELVRQQVTMSRVRASDASGTIRMLANTPTALTFPEEYDTLSEYDPATGIFTPRVAGYYHVSGMLGTIGFQIDSGEVLQFRINVGGAFKASGFRSFFYETANPPAVASSISTTVYLTAGQELALIGFTNRVEDADNNLLSASAANNYFSIDRLS